VATKQDLHRLIDDLPEHAHGAAEAFLVFLRDRDAAGRQSSSHFDEQRWAAGKRLGLANRRRKRDAGAGPEGQDDGSSSV
jgi:hypothetical protein